MKSVFLTERFENDNRLGAMYRTKGGIDGDKREAIFAQDAGFLDSPGKGDPD